MTKPEFRNPKEARMTNFEIWRDHVCSPAFRPKERQSHFKKLSDRLKPALRTRTTKFEIWASSFFRISAFEEIR
jgi:hypothetical protein